MHMERRRGFVLHTQIDIETSNTPGKRMSVLLGGLPCEQHTNSAYT